MNIVKRPLPVSNGNNPNRKINPDTIVVHYMGDPDVSAERLALCFENNNANNVSSNYIVDPKQIIEVIFPGYMSYCVSNHNTHTINIECAHTKTGQFDLRTIIHLRQIVRKLMRDFNIPASRVVRHYDLTGKHCPMYYVTNPREWYWLHKIITSNKKGVFPD